MSAKGKRFTGSSWTAADVIVSPGNLGVAYTIPDNADLVIGTLDQASCAIKLPMPTKGGEFDLELTQGTGGTKAITFVGPILQPGGAAPAISTAAAAIDIVHGKCYDGVKWVVSLGPKALA